MSEKDFNTIFSNRLRHYLTESKMTQNELAKRLGVGTTSVYNWCNAVKTPRMDKVDAMCTIFNCQRSDLMTENPAVDNPISKIAYSEEIEEVIKKYCALDCHGKKIVDFILQEEWERTKQEVI